MEYIKNEIEINFFLVQNAIKISKTENFDEIPLLIYTIKPNNVFQTSSLSNIIKNGNSLESYLVLKNFRISYKIWKKRIETETENV